MRSLKPKCEEPIKVTKLHNIVEFYRNGGRLDEQIEQGARSNSGSYDYGTYDDVKPESMDNPPIQHIDRLTANCNSHDPIVHKPENFGYVQKSEEIPVKPSDESLRTSEAPAPTPTSSE